MIFGRLGRVFLIPARISGLFQRYTARHLQVSGLAQVILGQKDQKIGEIEQLQISEGRLHLKGWCRADQVELYLGDAQIGQWLGRPETTNKAAFELKLPLQDGPASLHLHKEGQTFSVPVSVPPQFWARQHLRLRFMRDLLRSVPGIVGWMITKDRKYRTRIKRILDLRQEVETRPVREDLFRSELPSDLSTLSDTISLILPVYNAFDLLPEVLARVLKHTDLPYRLLILEDCSSDPAVRPYLRKWHAGLSASEQAAVTVIENPENQGFVGSVNTGLTWALEHGDHVVLINSDAFLPSGWASRLLAPLGDRPEVATVTPMSNDAEIFSVPTICQRLDLKPGQAEAIDAVALQFSPEAVIAPAPTGVGFCMAMNIDHLRQVPQLDKVFGRGYGEEVDWCQKLLALGGVHLGLGGLFVEHRGGAAFGSVEKQRLVTRNNAIISGRYPGYDQSVQNFIRDDPLVSPRLALALAWVGTLGPAPVPIYMAHSLGGGADLYLHNRIAGDLETIGAAVVIRVAGPQGRWQLDVHSPQGLVSGATDSSALLEQLLAPVTSRKLIYSNAVGDPDPIEVPALLLRLKQAGDQLEVLFHDFFPISPSYTLLNAAGRYLGPVTLDQAEDPAHHSTRPDGSFVSLADWQTAWGEMIHAADTVVVFSQDSAQQVRAAYPKVSLELRPHKMLHEVPNLLAAKTPDQDSVKAPMVVAVLGNINEIKGGRVVTDLARKIKKIPDLSLVLIGNIDPMFVLPRSVPVHGDYRMEELSGLVKRYGITDWLIPSIWPETFSYTTHEALATGLPVYCFDLGGQAEAVARAENGHVVGFDRDGAFAETMLEAFQNHKDP